MGVLDDYPFAGLSSDYVAGLHEGVRLAEARADELEELLAEARLQIEYLHDKFKETGSGNTVIARIRLALTPRGEGDCK